MDQTILYPFKHHSNTGYNLCCVSLFFTMSKSEFIALWPKPGQKAKSRGAPIVRRRPSALASAPARRSGRSPALPYPPREYLHCTMRLLRFQSYECSVLRHDNSSQWWRVLAGKGQGQGAFELLHDFHSLLLAQFGQR